MSDTDPGYRDLRPDNLEQTVAADLDRALSKRGADVVHDGAPGRPDMIVEADRFAFIVEVARRSGADAASEYLAINEHRADTERELGKRTHLLFSCLATPGRLVQAMQNENSRRVADGDPARSLFLSLDHLELVLERLTSESADLFPLTRWEDWFEAWEDIGGDLMALEKMQEIVFADDRAMNQEVEGLKEQRVQHEQEALRKDVRRLEDVLRHRNVVRDAAMKVLVYLMFVKLYEEKRETQA